MWVRIETGGQECDRMETEGESVSWDKSRSMIQLCARQRGNEKRNRGTERREKKGETETQEGEERKCCEYSRDGEKKEARRNI